ncbi:hypothetical protein NUH86_18515 [Sphingobium sp. JS3065]|uniref:hypothetical protein n=1 Tax=Sphingobium sp. JS3065 TaxID=2970925 RepID=UPI002264AEAA|nr:hypothetical protein [Sphingobium sp. JS3065]UZW57834.1 hypothetical protein NUH86_18515 [Sphingobium sp. JS3065]
MHFGIDSYESERRPHAVKLMHASRKLGILTDGILARDASGKPMPGAGSLPALWTILSTTAFHHE